MGGCVGVIPSMTPASVKKLVQGCNNINKWCRKHKHTHAHIKTTALLGIEVEKQQEPFHGNTCTKLGTLGQVEWNVAKWATFYTWWFHYKIKVFVFFSNNRYYIYIYQVFWTHGHLIELSNYSSFKTMTQQSNLLKVGVTWAWGWGKWSSLGVIVLCSIQF